MAYNPHDNPVLQMRKLKQNLRWYIAEPGVKSGYLHCHIRQDPGFAEEVGPELSRRGEAVVILGWLFLNQVLFQNKTGFIRIIHMIK